MDLYRRSKQRKGALRAFQVKEEWITKLLKELHYQQAYLLSVGKNITKSTRSYRSSVTS